MKTTLSKIIMRPLAQSPRVAYGALLASLELKNAETLEALKKVTAAADWLREQLYKQMLYEGNLTERNPRNNAAKAAATAFRFDADLTAAKAILANHRDHPRETNTMSNQNETPPASGVATGWGQSAPAGPIRVTRDVATDGTVTQYGWDGQSTAPLWKKITYPDGSSLEW